MQKKHESTTVLNKQKRTFCEFKCWLKCHLTSFEALLSLEKKNDPPPSESAVSLFCVLSHKNDIRQNCVISNVSSCHIGGTCPVKELKWSRNGAFWERQKKKAATHIPSLLLGSRVFFWLQPWVPPVSKMWLHRVVVMWSRHVVAKWPKSANTTLKQLQIILDRFLNSPRYRESPINIGCNEDHSAGLDEIAAKDHSYIAAAAKRTGPKGPMNHLKKYQEAKRIKFYFFKSLAKLTQDFIPVNMFDSDQVNQSPGTMKALSVSTQRLAGGGIPRIHQQVLLLRDGIRLRGGNVLRGGRHQVGMNSDFSFIPSVKYFAYKQWRFPCKRREV